MIVATFGNPEWLNLALDRAIPSALAAAPLEVIPIHQPHGTVCTSRNAGAEMATGGWLAFLDADDELDPAFVGSMRRAYERHLGTDGNHGPVLLTPAVNRPGRKRAPTFRPEKPLQDSNWLVIGTLIERDFFWEIGGFDEQDRHGLEDWSLWLRAETAGATVVKVPDAVYIAHTRRVSSHAAYARTPEYGREYTRIRRSVLPHLYQDAT